MSQAETGINDGEAKGKEGVVDVSSLTSMSIHKFLTHFELNPEIATPLADEEITDVETLFECDVNDIIGITKTFSKNNKITRQDKIKFRKIMKMVIEENEKQIESTASLSSKSKTNTMVILSASEHNIISKFYSKLDEIESDTKTMKENVNSVNKQSKNNIISINNYYDSLIELIKERKEKILNEHKQIVKYKIDEYQSIISSLKEFETIVTKEIDLIKNELLVRKVNNNYNLNENNKGLKNDNNNNSNNNNNNDSNKDKYKNDILKQFVVSPKEREAKLNQLWAKIEKYEKETGETRSQRETARVVFVGKPDHSGTV